MTVEAKIASVERSKAGLRKGNNIVIRYKHIDTNRGKDYIGPRPIPILDRGGAYPAFLKKDGDSYEPVAHGESFKMPPEG